MTSVWTSPFGQFQLHELNDLAKNWPFQKYIPSNYENINYFRLWLFFFFFRCGSCSIRSIFCHRLTYNFDVASVSHFVFLFFLLLISINPFYADIMIKVMDCCKINEMIYLLKTNRSIVDACVRRLLYVFFLYFSFCLHFLSLISFQFSSLFFILSFHFILIFFCFSLFSLLFLVWSHVRYVLVHVKNTKQNLRGNSGYDWLNEKNRLFLIVLSFSTSSIGICHNYIFFVFCRFIYFLYNYSCNQHNILNRMSKKMEFARFCF